MPYTFKYYYGTPAGGRKAASTNKEKYGKDFYVNIGRKGGTAGGTGGFFANPALAKVAGSIGGRNSYKGFRLSRIGENGDRYYRRLADGKTYVKREGANELVLANPAG